MKTLFGCGTAMHTSQGQSGLWRWFYYYRAFQSLFRATHYATNNDGCENLPIEPFVRRYPGERQIPPLSQDQLSLIYWPAPLPHRLYDCPGYCRTVSTLARIALEQDFDKLIYVEWDFWILSEAMMREIADIQHGLVTYWSPRYGFGESNLIICGRDQLDILRRSADESSKSNLTKTEIPEWSWPWTEVRKHREGDRYPEVTDSLPRSADYCGQLPGSHAIYNRSIIRLAWELCPRCGVRVERDLRHCLACPDCHPERFQKVHR